MADVVFLESLYPKSGALYENGELVGSNGEIDFHTASQIYHNQGKTMKYYLPINTRAVMVLHENGWPQQLEDISIEYFEEQDIWWLQSA